MKSSPVKAVRIALALAVVAGGYAAGAGWSRALSRVPEAFWEPLAAPNAPPPQTPENAPSDAVCASPWFSQPPGQIEVTTTGDGYATVRCLPRAAGQQPWTHLVRRSTVPLAAPASYRFAFRVRADRSRTIHWAVQDFAPSGSRSLLYEKIECGPDWTLIERTALTSRAAPVWLEWQLGAGAAAVEIGDVQVTRVQP